jgi:hypothetical protein
MGGFGSGICGVLVFVASFLRSVQSFFPLVLRFELKKFFSHPYIAR